MKRAGRDCTIVTWGRPVHFALEAAGELAKTGVECEVLDIRSIRPLDIEAIVRSVKKTGYCVVVDQTWPFASVASEIAAQVYERAMDYLDNRVYRVNNDDVPAPYARNLEQQMLPNTRKIVEAVRAATYRA